MKKLFILFISFILLAAGQISIAKAVQVLDMPDQIMQLGQCHDDTEKTSSNCCQKNCYCTSLSCSYVPTALFAVNSQTFFIEAQQSFIIKSSNVHSVAYTPPLRPPKA